MRRLPAALLLMALFSGSLAALALAESGGASGRPLEAKLERLDGTKLRLSELRGKPVLLELWATWCAPCRQQAEVVHGLAAELSAREVRVLAVDVGESPKVVREYLAKNPGHFEVALDPGQAIFGRLGIGVLPAIVLLDAEGKVLGVRMGLTRREALLELLSRVGGTPAG